MVSTRTLMHGSRPLNLYSVFDFDIADYEIQGGFCQLQLDVAAHIPNGEYTVDWGGRDNRQADSLPGLARLHEGWSLSHTHRPGGEAVAALGVLYENIRAANFHITPRNLSDLLGRFS